MKVKTENSAYRVAVLLSGNGSNLQALLDASASGAPYQVVAVISNNPDAYGLQRANLANIPTHTINHRNFTSRALFEQTLLQTLQQYQPDLIVLAGFMRRLTPLFVGAFYGRIINIHPSLLPKHPGLNTHAAALAAGDREHGATVHFVNAELDAGPVIAQATLPINADDDSESLKQRVQQLEHKLYPQVVALLALGRVTLTTTNSIYLDQHPLPLEGLKMDAL